MATTSSHSKQDAVNLEKKLTLTERHLRVIEMEQRDFDVAIKDILRSFIYAFDTPGIDPEGRRTIERLSKDLSKPDLLTADSIVNHHRDLLRILKPIGIRNQDSEASADLTPQSTNNKPGLSSEPDLDKRTQIIRAFSNLVAEISQIKNASYAQTGQELSSLSLQPNTDWLDLLNKATDLVIKIKYDIWQEKASILKNISQIIKGLEDTERDFLKAMQNNQGYLSESNSTFNSQMENGISEIEGMMAVPETCSSSQASLDTLFGQVLSKVSQIRDCINKKKGDDAAHLSSMKQEQEQIEKQLGRFHRDYDEFSSKSREMLEEIEKLREISLRDPLTQAYNRRAYEAHINKSLEEYHNKSIKTASLIIFDIDKFRDFNNNFGHLVGDKILNYVARLTQENIRKDDFLFRYGGDEFIIILPNAAGKDAARVAEKVRKNIAEVEFKLLKQGNKTITVTISMGVTEFLPDDNPNSLFLRADQALYKSKSSGRNMVTMG